MSTSPLAGGPASYPVLLPRGAGTKGHSGGWDLYPLTLSDDLLPLTPTLTSYTNKKWGEASKVCSTPFVPPLQSSASRGPGRCSRRKWKAFDALSLQLRADEGHQGCFFLEDTGEQGGVLSHLTHLCNLPAGTRAPTP